MLLLLGKTFIQNKLKALREAKVNSRWRDPDEDYEQAVIAFLQAIFDDTKSKIFLSDFKEFASRIAFYGAINSLCALVLKLCAPGIPDIYQGMELWEFTLVDPDNRREVDFPARINATKSRGMSGDAFDRSTTLSPTQTPRRAVPF